MRPGIFPACAEARINAGRRKKESGMKAAEVELGGIYVVNVSGRRVPVKVTGENQYGGWNGINMKTGRDVRIHSSRRLQKRLRMMTELADALDG
jgi:hypothetical protein